MSETKQKALSDNTNPMLNQVTLILVGIGVFLAMGIGLTTIANSIEHIPVATSVAEPRIIPLSHDRFAVVDSDADEIHVFEVDASGHVHQTDSVTYANAEPRDLAVPSKSKPGQQRLPDEQ